MSIVGPLLAQSAAALPHAERTHAPSRARGTRGAPGHTPIRDEDQLLVDVEALADDAASRPVTESAGEQAKQERRRRGQGQPTPRQPDLDSERPRLDVAG